MKTKASYWASMEEEASMLGSASTKALRRFVESKLKTDRTDKTDPDQFEKFTLK